MKQTKKDNDFADNGSAKAVVGLMVRVHKNNLSEAVEDIQEVLETYKIEKVETDRAEKELCITFNNFGQKCAVPIMSDEEETKYFRDLKLRLYTSSM